MPGYDRFIDLDVYNGTEAELRASLRGIATQVAVETLDHHATVLVVDLQHFATLAGIVTGCNLDRVACSNTHRRHLILIRCYS